MTITLFLFFLILIVGFGICQIKIAKELGLLKNHVLMLAVVCKELNERPYMSASEN